MKKLPKVPTWRLERDSNPRSRGILYVSFTVPIDLSCKVMSPLSLTCSAGWLHDWISTAQLLQSHNALIRPPPVSPVHIRSRGPRKNIVNPRCSRIYNNYNYN